MDKQLTITISAILNERSYVFMVPFGAPYEDVFAILKNITVDLQDQQQQEKDRAAAAPISVQTDQDQPKEQ